MTVRPAYDDGMHLWASLAFILIVAALTWHTFALHIDLAYAWKGWSVLTWLAHERLPENFAKDFSQGTSLYAKSAFLHIYPLAERWLGISPEFMLHVVPALELAFVAFASWALARGFLKRDRAPVAALVFAYVVASAGANLDLARFGMPYSYTLYYYTAEASRLAAVACAVRRQYVASALLLAAAAVTHPMMSLYACLFIVAMMAVTPRDFTSRSALTGLILFCAIVLPWVMFQFARDTSLSMTGEAVPFELWLAIMRAFNYHFFPVEFGVFTQADVRFLPLLSFLALWSHYVTRIGLAPQTVKRLTFGVVTMAAVAATGVVLSEWAPSPVVAKISLHRASLLGVLVALPVVVAGLWRDLIGESLVRRIAAAGALFAAFLMEPGWPLIFTVVLCQPSWWPALAKKRPAAADWITTALLAGTLLLSVYYVASGFVSQSSPFFRTDLSLWYAIAACWILWAALARLIDARRARGLASLAIALASASVWLSHQAIPEDQLRLYADYKAAQTWAREHTPRTSLFMVDPSHHYGWRDFSQRSSFGNLHEWLHTSWVYTSNVAAFREGYARFQEFDIDLAPYLNQRPSVIKGHEALSPVIGQRYNSADDAWRRAMADKYGIDYFVINKRAWKSRSELPVAFENVNFLVLRAEGGR